MIYRENFLKIGKWEFFIVHIILSYVFINLTMKELNIVEDIFQYFFVARSCDYGAEYCQKTEILFRIKYFLFLFLIAQAPLITILLFRLDKSMSVKVFIILLNVPGLYILSQNSSLDFRTIDQDCLEVKPGFKSCKEIVILGWTKIMILSGKIYLITPFTVWVVGKAARKIGRF